MKRVLALFMAAFMMLLMVPETVHAASENVTLVVSADKSVAIPGETVNFAVAIGKVESLGVLEFTLNIPDGLTISESSVTLPEGLGTILDSDGEIIKPAEINGYKWSYSAQMTGYKGESDLIILNFSCTVDADSALEAKSVTINVATCCDNINIDEHVVSVTPATVTVKKAPVAVTGVTLNTNALSLKDGEEATLTASVVPGDADNQGVTWSSSDSQVVTVDKGVVKALKPGTATITVTTQEGNKTATCTVTVACNHSMTKTDAKAATCVASGNIEYYTCGKCSKMFSDAEGKTEVTKVEIAATGKHTEEVRGAVEATEDKVGYTGDTYCTVCEQKLSTGTEIAKLPHTHNMVKTEAVSPSCEVAGNITYYTCSKCNKMYSDEAGTNEVTDITVPATGHSASDSWKYDETNHWKECVGCDKKYEEAAHIYQWVVDSAATVEAPGVKHEECECGHKRSENTAIAQLSHEHTDIIHHEATEPTCSKTGNIEHWTCGHADCADKYYGDAQCQLEIADAILAIVPENHVYDSDADGLCNECEYRRFYEVVEGADGAYTKDSGAGLTIKVAGEFTLFDSVKVDDTVVDAQHYTVEEGSTIITFKDAYLNTLSSATHKVEVLYTDGKSAVTQFTVKNAVVPDDDDDDDEDEESVATPAPATNQNVATRSPKTGEQSTLWVVFVLLACVGATGITVLKRKQ